MREERIAELERLAGENGLDFFPVVFEVVSANTMNNVCSYGLPTRARHWSYGRSYDQQRIYGEMGFSKVYEMITNNDPSYAFVLDSNTEAQNLLIVAHCLGHSDFFKNNALFNGTDRNMAKHAAEHAARIDRYIETYGLDAVERMMDIAFALDDHIDIHKGLYRNKYPKRHIEERIVRLGEFDDLLEPGKALKPSRVREVVNATLPPHPEQDLLWFFINYAPLEDWERDILDIVREESFYFHPQRMTKIMNEGWAVYWHAELLHQYKGIAPEEMIDFARTHEKVVQPGDPFSINPYYLGYRIFKDIEKRWDEKHVAGESGTTGRQKIFEVRREEDDVSFLRNYLTVELVDELKLFTFGYENEYEKKSEDEEETLYEIKSRMRDEIVEALARPRYNNWAPKIVITDASSERIALRHDSEELGTLSFRYAEHVLEYIWELWAAPVELRTKDDDGKELVLLFDEAGFSQRSLEDDFGLEGDDEEQEIFSKTP
jgi:stage V sporulation protein R